MAKKDKKYAQPQTSTEVQNDTAASTTDAPAAEAPKSPIVRKNPQLFLQDWNGNQFKFTHFPLPKKAAVAGNVMIDGQETSYQVTSNKGFTPEENVIHYTWVTLPSGATGYIAHDYGVVPTAGIEYALKEGTTERKDPARVPKDDNVGANRVEKFKATMAAKAAAKPVEGTEAQPNEAGNAAEQPQGEVQVEAQA